MTIVFVHGNPETDAIWGPLVEALGRTDVVLLSPPGFGAPLPDDFPATYLAYRDWLEGELENIGGAIDLVGHDWGGGHVVNVVMHRPELVRSWASDIVGVFDPDYVWHDLAQVWQTPDEGEKSVDTMFGGSVEDRAALWAGLGIPSDIAASWAAAQGPEMGRAVLLLYRSAAQPATAAAARWRMRRPDRAFRFWPPRTRTSATSRSGVERPNGPGPTRRCSTVSGTGG
jgi:pimeloyl-ACP methyl ester carboxylesterase